MQKHFCKKKQKHIPVFLNSKRKYATMKSEIIFGRTVHSSDDMGTRWQMTAALVKRRLLLLCHTTYIFPWCHSRCLQNPHRACHDARMILISPVLLMLLKFVCMPSPRRTQNALTDTHHNVRVCLLGADDNLSEPAFL